MPIRQLTLGKLYEILEIDDVIDYRLFTLDNLRCAHLND